MLSKVYLVVWIRTLPCTSWNSCCFCCSSVSWIMGDLHSSYFVILFENHELAKLVLGVFTPKTTRMRLNCDCMLLHTGVSKLKVFRSSGHPNWLFWGTRICTYLRFENGTQFESFKVSTTKQFFIAIFLKRPIWS